MSLEERLRTHTSAFDGLLSLIPSKYYEDAGDGDDQWRKKKQSKEEKRKAKRAKLDPGNQVASQAKDVQDAKNELKGKAVIPTKESIKEKMEQFNTVEGVVEEPKGKKGGKKGGKKEVKGDNNKPQVNSKGGSKTTSNVSTKETDVKAANKNTSNSNKKETTNAKVNGKESEDDSIEAAPFADLVAESVTEETEKETKGEDDAAEAAAKEARLAALREKLNSRIQNLRADRKAPGTDPKKAPQSRAEILAARQKAKEARKEKKKLEREERRNQTNDGEDEGEEDDDDEADQSDSEPNLLYSQLHFETGEFSSDLKNLTSKKQGTKRDLLGQLNHVKAKRAKLQEMDLDKKKSVENATLWNRAMQHAKGEKVRDNEKLLTKAFKRQQQQKRKSEREWNDRRYTVDKHKRTKDKKRTENLQARRDSKKIKGKKVKPVKKPSSGKRAGFEGRLKSK